MDRCNKGSRPKSKKVPITQELIGNSKRPIVKESIYDRPPKWSFVNIDHEFCTLEEYCCQKDVAADLIKKLHDLEETTWGEIMSANGGKKKGHGTNSHYVSVSEFSSDARRRYYQIFSEEKQLQHEYQLFSLRLMNTHRIWGIITGDVFEIVWYDPDHRVCPSSG